ncbi:MAG TPA: hypothetical protein VHX61_13040 [Rhizomicrobium sp.]|jgi:hypothetical protein|nr:hypothetical protein [Rhizomicrobium sp.]
MKTPGGGSVNSYDSPLSDEKMRLLIDFDSTRCRIFLVVNKQDLVSEGERLEVQEHICARIRGVPGERIEIFSLSARDAMEANRSGDPDGFGRSGSPRTTK